MDRDEDDEHGKNTDVVDTVFLRNIPPKVTRAQLEEELNCGG